MSQQAEQGREMMKQADAAMKIQRHLEDTRRAIGEAGSDREKLQVLLRNAEGMVALHPDQPLCEKAMHECEAALARTDLPENSIEVMEYLNQLLKELPPPTHRILSLWSDGLSQDQIVEALRREKIHPRTKKYVNATLQEIKKKFENKGLVFTRPRSKTPSTAYEGEKDIVPVEEKTPDAILEENELETTIEAWKRASPEGKKSLEQQYGDHLRKQLKERGYISEKN